MSMTNDVLYQLGGIPVGAMDILMAGGTWQFCDPTNGTAGGDGSTPASACSSLKTCLARLRDGYNDGIIFLGGATSYQPTANIPWNKNYCHMIGISTKTGEGNRCHITGTPTNALAEVLTISGKGCRFVNIEVYNAPTIGTINGAATVSGSANEFYNCAFEGMMDVTSAAVPTAYSLTVTGDDNYFSKCKIGADTIVRTTGSPLIIGSASTQPARNHFDDCDIDSYSETAANVLVTITSADRITQFKNCRFYNFSVNWANGLTNAFSDVETRTHVIDLTGSYLINTHTNKGIVGWADTLTSFTSASGAPGAGFGISVAPTT